jgi:hypothetical protein
MLHQFIAACAAWERITESPWLSGPMGALNGIYLAVMVSLLWIWEPVLAGALGVLLVIAQRFLGWTKAFRVGTCIGAGATVIVELSFFWSI